MAIGDSLNPDCTVRASGMPRLFMSILAQRLHPLGVAARIECRASLRWRESLAGMSRTRTSISRASHYLCRKRDNVRDHRAGTIILQAEKSARKPGFACITLLSRAFAFRFRPRVIFTHAKVDEKRHPSKPQENTLYCCLLYTSPSPRDRG